MLDDSSVPETFLIDHARRVARRQTALERGEPPTILRIGDRLVLRCPDGRMERRVVDSRYDELKHACHILAWMASGLRESPQPIDDFLQYTRHAAKRSREPSARGLFALCEKELSRVAFDGLQDLDWESLRDQAEPLIRRCIQRAAELEVHGLHHATQTYLRSLGASAQRTVYFIVCGGHQPRYRELSKRYFTARFGEGGSEGARGERRTLYAENCDDESEALYLLAAQLEDRALSERLWGWPFAMQQDLLGPAAESAVASILRSDPGEGR